MSKRRRSGKWKEISKAQEDLLSGNPITITMKNGKLRRVVQINALPTHKSFVEVVVEATEEDSLRPARLRVDAAQKVQVWASMDDIR